MRSLFNNYPRRYLHRHREIKNFLSLMDNLPQTEDKDTQDISQIYCPLCNKQCPLDNLQCGKGRVNYGN